MKKILFLLLILFIKLNAFEYLIYDNSSAINTQLKEVFFVSENGIISKRVLANGRYTYGDTNVLNNFYQIKNGFKDYKYNKNTFTGLFRSDLVFLNAMYVEGGKFTNGLLNFLYNNKPFGEVYGTYVQYDYELLYNGDGLAVVSIVNDQWAGLYDDETRFASGKLYDKTGTLQYINGKAVKDMSPFDMINELFILSVQEIFGLMSRTACYAIGVLVVLVFAAFLFVLDLLHSSLSRVERLGSPWIATFDEKGKRVSKWGKNPNYFYHSSFNGPRNFPSWRDYTDYERKLSEDSSSSNSRKKVF